MNKKEAAAAINETAAYIGRKRTVLCFAGEEYELIPARDVKFASACPSCEELRAENPCENCGHAEPDKSQEEA